MGYRESINEVLDEKIDNFNDEYIKLVDGAEYVLILIEQLKQGIESDRIDTVEDIYEDIVHIKGSMEDFVNRL